MGNYLTLGVGNYLAFDTSPQLLASRSHWNLRRRSDAMIVLGHDRGLHAVLPEGRLVLVPHKRGWVHHVVDRILRRPVAAEVDRIEPLPDIVTGVRDAPVYSGHGPSST